MLHRLHIYTVHVKPGPRNAAQAPVFVREGFSFPAFIFTLAWSLYYRLWVVSALMLGFNVLVMWTEQEGLLTQPSVFVLLLAMQIFIGFHGNDWRRRALGKRGYITTAVVTGDSRLRAELRYFDQLVGQPG